MTLNNFLASKSGQAPLTGILYVLLLLVFLIIAVFVYELPPYLPLLLMISFSLFLVALLKPDFALAVLILSMLLSPEFMVGGISGRNVVFRYDDAMIFVIFFGWLARVAINKEINLLRPSYLNTPIILYIAICIFSSLLGALEGNVQLKQSFFYVTKYVEYYVLYFMVSNNLRSLRQTKMFTLVLVVTCLAVCVYAWAHMHSMARVSAPFEGESGEANTLAGYLLFMMSITLGLFLYEKRAKWQILYLGATAFMVPPFLFTLSRGTWLAFLPMSLVMMTLTRRGKGIIMVALFALFFLLPVLSPQAIKDRIAQTFISDESGAHQYDVLGKKFSLARSGVARVQTWGEAFQAWVKRPVLGYGVPASAIVDNQYARVVREVGTVGFCIYAWLMIRIFKAGRSSFRQTKGNDFAQGLSLGFLAGFIGLLFQAFSAETFILIRIMEPFWFVAAMVLVLPELPELSQLGAQSLT